MKDYDAFSERMGRESTQAKKTQSPERSDRAAGSWQGSQKSDAKQGWRAPSGSPFRNRGSSGSWGRWTL